MAHDMTQSVFDIPRSPTIRRAFGVLAALVAAVSFTATSSAQDYDLVINNGRVMDPETQFDDVANVAIKGGRIVAITEQPISGDETIDGAIVKCGV